MPTRRHSAPGRRWRCAVWSSWLWAWCLWAAAPAHAPPRRHGTGQRSWDGERARGQQAQRLDRPRQGAAPLCATSSPAAMIHRTLHTRAGSFSSRRSASLVAPFERSAAAARSRGSTPAAARLRGFLFHGWRCWRRSDAQPDHHLHPAQRPRRSPPHRAAWSSRLGPAVFCSNQGPGMRPACRSQLAVVSVLLIQALVDRVQKDQNARSFRSFSSAINFSML